MSKETKLLPCQYKGPSTLQNNNKVVDEIKEEDCDHDDDTKAFWNKYIAQRKPCVIRGKAKEYIKLMSNDNMIKVAGNEMVTAEERKDENDSFGKTDWSDDKRLHITFKEFINRVATSKVYMTTQDIPLTEEDNGPIKRMGSHIDKLIENNLIPLHPAPLKDTNLIQYQVNMWFGDAKNGSSTGLHHDYHDNIYMLLRGRKIFRIYSPDGLVKGLDTNGTTNDNNNNTVILDNGLICYNCHKLNNNKYSVRQDGAREVDVVRQNLIMNMNNNNEEEDDNELDKLLNIAIADADDIDDEEEDDEEEEPVSKKVRVNDDTNDDVDNNNTAAAVAAGPLHFCLHNTNPSIDNTYSKYIEIELLPGDMLYLPASYFHEVISYSTKQQSNDDVGHLAVNYWYHPPLFGSSYDKPYQDDFWSNRWNTILNH